ncbi:MAG TPA: hypothetical protein VLO07_05965 [Thermoanaerobaculia bacterium]|nr:hypothetical protein [Thermoanaerobaculia bacterium]
MQIRDSDWADPGEMAPHEDVVEEVEKTPSTRLTNFRRGRGFAPQSTDDKTLATMLEYAPEEIDDLLEGADEP